MKNKNLILQVVAVVCVAGAMWFLFSAFMGAFDSSYEARAIRAGYYCAEMDIVRSEHKDLCERVNAGESYRAVFPNMF